MKKISVDEMEKNKALATQESLVNLGRTMAKKDIERERLFSQIKLFEDKFEQINSNTTRSYTRHAFSVDVNAYVELIRQREIKNKLELKKLKSEFNELREENKNNIEELEELEQSIDNKWKKRVKSLREKCIEKNKKIRNYRYGLIGGCLIFYLLGYLGIDLFLNNVFNVTEPLMKVLKYLLSYLILGIVSLSFYIIDAMVLICNLIWTGLNNLFLYLLSLYKGLGFSFDSLPLFIQNIYFGVIYLYDSIIFISSSKYLLGAIMGTLIGLLIIFFIPLFFWGKLFINN